MKVIKLAKYLGLKYKFAGEAQQIEHSLRKKIDILWNYPNKNFNILRVCADAGVSKPTNPNEKKAVVGFKFCQELLSMIDYLKNNQYSLSLSKVRELLNNIIHLINKNKDLRFNEKGIPSEEGKAEGIQFPAVSELIFELIPINKRHDVKLKNEQFGKAKTGLSRILGLSLDMMNDIFELEKLLPEQFQEPLHETSEDIDEQLPKAFTPQRAPLSEYDIIDFIRQHGENYGISSTDDWGKIFMDDPKLKQEMTTVINALNRGHVARNDAEVKMQLAEIMREHEERKGNFRTQDKRL